MLAESGWLSGDKTARYVGGGGWMDDMTSNN